VYKIESRKKNQKKGTIIGFFGREESNEKTRMRGLTDYNETIAWEPISNLSIVILGSQNTLHQL
jgi:hypothetical protein